MKKSQSMRDNLKKIKCRAKEVLNYWIKYILELFKKVKLQDLGRFSITIKICN